MSSERVTRDTKTRMAIARLAKIQRARRQERVDRAAHAEWMSSRDNTVASGPHSRPTGQTEVSESSADDYGTPDACPVAHERER